jgi:putative N6-adenine-specific DNA methylase
MARYFATCARGLEKLLAQELQVLGARAVQPGRGGVGFDGDRTLLYRANLWLRTAIRVLQPVLEATVHSPDELYDAVQSVDWSSYLTPEHTLAVDANVRDSAITHSQYAARRVKDAICDQFRQRTGRRPNVDPDEPLVPLNLHIHRNVAVLSLDSSGQSLHKRGYRPVLTKAPLNEALAAGLLLLSGWQGTTAFLDPMCGSGTLPIEAAWIAGRRAPGLTRKRFAFQSWLDFDIAAWTELRDEARRQMATHLPVRIVGMDARRDVVDSAQKNARAAGVGHWLQFSTADIAHFQPPDELQGTVLVNPPYGERLGRSSDLHPLYRQLGAMFQRLPHWRCWVFTGNIALTRSIRLPVVERYDLFNGPIHCQLLRFDSQG